MTRKIRVFVPPEPPKPAPGGGERPVRYLSVREVAERIGQHADALSAALRRARHDERAPAPDVQIGPDGNRGTQFGWAPGREDEVREWLRTLPGTGSAPRSGRWRDEAGEVPEGLEWVSITGSRGTDDHVPGADGPVMLCGRKAPKGTGPPRGLGRCGTCGKVAARNARR